MDIKDILKGRNIPKEPEESRLLKDYVNDKYKVMPQIVISPHHLTLIVPNAALASTLRMELPTMIAACRITKKLHIRIS